MLCMRGDILGQDKETKTKLLLSARQEFIEKGYMKASLRTICKNAGVTTGALYFFFEDKEALFEAVTKETVNGILQIMKAHFQEEREMMATGRIFTMEPEEMKDDLDTAEMIIHQMYLHRDDVLLVLTKSQGSRLENIVDQFVELSEVHYQMMAKVMQEAYPDAKTDENFIHWLSHELIEAFIYVITHIESEQEAVAFLHQMTTYMMAGWYGLFQMKKGPEQ